MFAAVQRMLKDESGATAIEYGLIAALIGAALITALETLEGDLSSLFTGIGDKLTVGGGDGTT